MAERILITGGSGFIGSHLVRAIAARGYSVANLDIKRPSIGEDEAHWHACDIKDLRALALAFQKFQPTRVIHLAAKANLNGKSVRDFPDNTFGTENVVRCVNETNNVRLFVNTSTQYVVMPGVCPPDDDFHKPYTVYGESKAAAEIAVREYCEKPWAIIRPTNIWGPRHPFFPYEMWRYLEHRLYLHPGYRPIRKYYGYIENAIRQIIKVAFQERLNIGQRRVYYITDDAIDSADWMNGFSFALCGKPARRVPKRVWRGLASVGDVVRALKLPFPVNSERFFRLTVNEDLPNELIVQLERESLISLAEGIAETVSWYKNMRRSASSGGGR